MPEYPLTGIVMATLLEALPFVNHLSLKTYSHTPFDAYEHGHIRLVISGIGKANAAMAATWLILTKHPARVFNLGAAGALDESLCLGEILHISRVIEPDRPVLGTDRIFEHVPDLLQGYEMAVLATQDKPVIMPEERARISAHARLADMEGASVVQVCRQFGIPCHLFKFVSDTPENHRIKENIEQYREAFFHRVRNIIAQK